MKEKEVEFRFEGARAITILISYLCIILMATVMGYDIGRFLLMAAMTLPVAFLAIFSVHKN